MSDDEIIERLAAAEHLRWSNWQRYMHSKCMCNDAGDLIVPADLVKRWERQMVTPYRLLSENERESDRAEARTILANVRQLDREGAGRNGEGTCQR